MIGLVAKIRGLALKESPEIAAEFSFEKEKVIAKSFSQRFQWEMILIGLDRLLYGFLFGR